MKFAMRGIFAALLLTLFSVSLEQTILTAPSGLSPVQAQDANTCESLVVDALQTIGSACVSLGRNEVCYGNTLVSAVLADAALEFNEAGDTLGLINVETLITRPADPEAGTWGVALLDLAADLPEASGATLRMVVFGGTEIEAQATEALPDVTCTYTNPNENGINMRAIPSLLGRGVDLLDAGDTVEVSGQSADGQWLRASRGWVNLSVGDIGTCNLDALPVLDSPASLYNQPFQAVTLRSDGGGSCENAPGGLLVQSPTGETGNVLVNGVEIRVGSTGFVSIDSNIMTISNLDNQVTATLNGTSARIPVGGSVSVAVDEDGNAIGTFGPLNPLPQEAQSLDDDFLATVLPEAISVPPVFIPAQVTNNNAGNNDPNAPSAEEILGQMGVCGGCADCGPYPSSECILLDDGTCTWDPATCRGIAPVTTPTLSVGPVTCNQGTNITVSAGFTPSPITGDPLAFASASSSNTTIAVIDGTTVMGNTVIIVINCLAAGSATINVQAQDTQDLPASASFNLNIVP